MMIAAVVLLVLVLPSAPLSIDRSTCRWVWKGAWVRPCDWILLPAAAARIRWMEIVFIRYQGSARPKQAQIDPRQSERRVEFTY